MSELVPLLLSVPGCVCDLCRGLLELDYAEHLLDYAHAANFVGLPEATVRQWKSRRLLPVAGQAERGRPLFRPVDVMRAEHRTRATPGGRKRQGAA